MNEFPPLSTLRTFESAARHLSFKAAADELFVTPSSVSHQIKKLENWLGTKLFNRLNRRISLTAEGNLYHAIVAKALNDIANGTSLINRNSKAEEIRRRLVIGANSGFIDCWLNPRIEGFRKIAPDVELQFVYGDDAETHRNNNADISILYSKEAPKEAGAILLGRYREFVVCSAKTTVAGQRISQLADLRNVTLLHEQDFLSWKNWLEKFGFGDVDATNGPIYQNTNSIFSRVKAGDGVALGDMLVAGDALKQGHLVKPFPQSRLSDWSTYLIPSTSQASQDIDLFSGWLRKLLHEYEAEMGFLEDETSFPRH